MNCEVRSRCTDRSGLQRTHPSLTILLHPTDVVVAMATLKEGRALKHEWMIQSLLTLTDARNFTTTWTYNLRGQLLTKVYPNGDDHVYLNGVMFHSNKMGLTVLFHSPFDELCQEHCVINIRVRSTT